MRVSEADLVRYGYGLYFDSEVQPVAVFRAYFDGSARGGITTLAGYVAPNYRWAKLGKQWIRTLEAFDISPPVFHMTDFESGKKAFANLTAEQRVALIKKLIGLIRGHTTLGVAQGIFAADCGAVREQLRRLKVPDYADPYSVCLIACLTKLKGAYDRGEIPTRRGEPIACVFDYDRQRTARLRRAFEGITTQLKLDIFDPMVQFRSRHERVGIQAADILAYEAMKDIKNRFVERGKRPVRKSWAALSREGINLRGAYYGAGRYIEMVYGAAVHARAHSRARRDVKPNGR